jgi:putative oxidoreductase
VFAPVVARYALLPLRLVVGYGFLAHGLAKWSIGPMAFASILHAVGVPAPELMAWVTILVEILGGFAILLRAFVALVSIPTVVLLAVAVFSVHLPMASAQSSSSASSAGRLSSDRLDTNVICSISSRS